MSLKPRDLVWLRNVVIFVGLLCIAGLVCVVMPFLIWPPGQVLGMYKIEDSVEITSPDGRYIASGYHLYGSAIVDDSTIILLGPRWNWFSDRTTDSVLIVDMTQSKNPFSISWQDDTHLVVTYTTGSVFLKKSAWRDVHIAYIEK